MSSSITEAPISGADNKSKRGNDNLESEAVGLDIAVRIHGSQVTAVVLDTTEHVEPFEEDTSTMIVFPRGAVVKLRARVRTGHTVILTNLQTKQTAPCQIIQVNAGNAAHYVKLEFNEAVPGFWGVHFPSDSSSAAAPATQEPLALKSEIQEFGASNSPDQTWAHKTPQSPTRTQLPASSRDFAKQLDASQAVTTKPIEISKEASGAKYEVVRDTPAEIVPLAATPVKAPPSLPMPSARIPESKPASRTKPASPSSVPSPIFDSLSTDEDIFGPEKASAPADRVSKPSKAPELELRSLRQPILSHRSSANRSATWILIASAAVIALAAGGAWYFLQQRTSMAQRVTGAASAPSATTALNPTQSPVNASATVQHSETADASLSTQPAAEQTSPANAQPAADAPHTQPEESTITVTPAPPKSAVGAPASAVPATNAANTIYAGNLNARPKQNNAPKMRIAATLPKINVVVPSNLTGAPVAGGLGSLVSNGTTGLPAPPAPAPTPVSGGKLVQPRLIRSVSPSYPAIANANRVQGDVQIQAMIDENGKVTSAKVISGPSLLRNAAVTAVRQWRYSPATLDGKPIAMQYAVTVRFRLGQE